MFSIGFFEILVIGVLGLLVFGPEKLPDAIRTFAFGLSKVKRSWNDTRRDLEQELGMDEIRREIHNAEVMRDLDQLSEENQKAAKAFAEKVEKNLVEAIDDSAEPDSDGENHKIANETPDSPADAKDT